MQLGSDHTQVLGTDAAVPLAGEALANVLRRHAQLDRILTVIERTRRNREVVMVAAREERLGPEAFRDRELLEGDRAASPRGADLASRPRARNGHHRREPRRASFP